jgi:1,4-alpha-glucan branching enzyme
VGDHARHFAHLLRTVAAEKERASGQVIVDPFDAELFGHWWFEGPQFIADVYRELLLDRERSRVRPATASEHLAATRGATVPLQLPAGSWGKEGDYSMWLNEQTAWTWEAMWPLEERFWNVVAARISDPRAQPVIAQAARELLLAQASDWQFMISTGAVPDYGVSRFRLHLDATSQLVAALETRDLDAGLLLAETLHARDRLFPTVLDAVAASVGRSAAVA